MRAAKNANARRQPGEGASKNADDRQIIADMREQIKARVTVGETIAATDYSESERPAYWGAIAQLQDELPNLKPAWRTIAEQIVAGRKLREKVFRLRGCIDTALAGWLCIGIAALVLMVRGAI